MSTEAVMAFTEKVAGNEALQEKVKAIAAMESERAEGIAALGREHGFAFTSTEFVEVAQAARELNQGELSEAEMEVVAGGTVATAGQILSPTAIYQMVGLSVKNIQSLP